MFRNLRAEMARHDFTDADMAKKLGITREGFAKKKKTGFFTMPEIRLMLAMFGTSFEYLFDIAEEDDADQHGEARSHIVRHSVRQIPAKNISERRPKW